jgi:hypothetical protein
MKNKNERQWTHRGIKSFMSTSERFTEVHLGICVVRPSALATTIFKPETRNKLSASTNEKKPTADDLKTNLAGLISNYITKTIHIYSTYQKNCFFSDDCRSLAIIFIYTRTD